LLLLLQVWLLLLLLQVWLLLLVVRVAGRRQLHHRPPARLIDQLLQLIACLEPRRLQHVPASTAVGVGCTPGPAARPVGAAEEQVLLLLQLASGVGCG
jgi:hypothetical protein